MERDLAQLRRRLAEVSGGRCAAGKNESDKVARRDGIRSASELAHLASVVAVTGLDGA